MLQNIQPSEGITVIFDIKKYVVGAKGYVDFGYAIFPLFDLLETDETVGTKEFYINSGIYSVFSF